MLTFKSTHYFCASTCFRRSVFISSFLLIVLCGFPLVAMANDVLIGTGAPGTFSHFTGRMICRAMSNGTVAANCQVVPTVDDVDNLTNLRGGSLDIGIVDSRMFVDAVKKSGHFEFLDISYENLRLLAPLYDIPITLVVRADAGITTLDAFKGKRINAGAPRSLGALALETIMQAKNWTAQDFSLIGELPPSQSQDSMAFCHGTMQAMVHIGVHPSDSLRQLFKLCQAVLVNMDDGDIGKMVESDTALWKSGITANTYARNPDAVSTFGTRALLVASEDLDVDTVYQILATIYQSQDRLKNAHPALSLLTNSEVKESTVGLQFHPGAFKYFSE